MNCCLCQGTSQLVFLLMYVLCIMLVVMLLWQVMETQISYEWWMIIYQSRAMFRTTLPIPLFLQGHDHEQVLDCDSGRNWKNRKLWSLRSLFVGHRSAFTSLVPSGQLRFQNGSSVNWLTLVLCLTFCRT